MQVGIAEAARKLNVSEHTVRRWLRSGQLSGDQMATPQGYTWMVELPEDGPGVDSIERVEYGEKAEYGDSKTIEVFEELVSTLKVQVTSQGEELEAKNRQIGELHVLLQQAQAALPAPREEQHTWWRFW